MRESKKHKKKGRLQLKNAKNTFCNKDTTQGDTYKKH